MSTPMGLTHFGQAHIDPKSVWYEGTDEIQAGVGVCYNRDATVSTNDEAERDQRIERPSNTNNLTFAGVTLEKIDAGSTIRRVNIATPGSSCKVLCLIATTANTTRLTAVASGPATGRGRGAFIEGGWEGRGSAIAMQTVANITDIAGTTPGPIFAARDATYTTATKTVTKTAAFTHARAGDYVWIYSGATTADGTAALTPGRYKILTRTSANAVILETAAGSADSAALAIYVVRGDPMVTAYLQDGKESGLTEYVQSVTAAALTFMPGGFTRLQGGTTQGTAATVTLADGLFAGMYKTVLLTGTLVTNGVAMTVTTGITPDPSNANIGLPFDALATVTFLTTAAYWSGVWDGVKWVTIGSLTATLA